MDELKPCPCCGGVASVIKHTGYSIGVFNVTVRCDAGCLTTLKQRTPEIAVHIWNTRTPTEITVES